MNILMGEQVHLRFLPIAATRPGGSHGGRNLADVFSAAPDPAASGGDGEFFETCRENYFRRKPAWPSALWAVQGAPKLPAVSLCPVPNEF